MLTRNYYLINAGWYGKSNGLHHYMKNVKGKLTQNPSGTYMDDAFFRCDRLNVEPGMLDRGWCFGDGTATPTLDDYCLSGNHITTLALSNYSVSNEVMENEIVVVATTTVQNTGSENVTINEAGYTSCTWSSNVNDEYLYLIFRDVLDTPITLKPGESGKVTLTLTFPIPQ